MAQQLVHGIFAAVPYCIDLIGGPVPGNGGRGVQGLSAQSGAPATTVIRSPAPDKRKPLAACRRRTYLPTSWLKRLGLEALRARCIHRHAVGVRSAGAPIVSRSAFHSSAIWWSCPDGAT